MFKVLTKGCEPTRGSKYSACVDLYASEDVVIGAGETKLVGLGVAIDYERIKDMYLESFFEKHYLQLMLRSSLAKKGLIIANGLGVIDLDYKDEIKIAIHNIANLYDFAGKPRVIKKGDKIAQITLLEHKSHLFGIESDEERKGGFGSTGE